MKRFHIVAAVLACFALVLSVLFGGTKGLIGMSAGLIATFVSLYGWWPAIRLLGQVAEEAKPKDGRIGSSYVVLLFLVKAPVFFVLAFFARTIGGAATACFLLGMGLVYSLLIGWSLSYDARSA